MIEAAILNCVLNRDLNSQPQRNAKHPWKNNTFGWVQRGQKRAKSPVKTALSGVNCVDSYSFRTSKNQFLVCIGYESLSGLVFWDEVPCWGFRPPPLFWDTTSEAFPPCLGTPLLSLCDT